MKQFAFIILVAALAVGVFGQRPKPSPAKSPKPTPKPAKTVVPQIGTEAEEFEKAKAVADAAERIAALQTFLTNFPEGAETERAKGLIVSARAVLAEGRLDAGDLPGAITLFTQAVGDAPSPIGKELFGNVILGFPFSLKSRGQLGPAFDIVKLIEEKVGSNPEQILDLAKFFITVQYGTEAIRLAEKSIALDPASEFAYQTAAIAYRMNFRLEDSANASAKALEINPSSASARQNLAEMRRALGKYDEAIALYRETLALDQSNVGARNGLIMALFESGKRTDAESELKSSLESNSNNPSLLTGVAYWYAAAKDVEKADTFSKMALAADPTNVWAYIAQGRTLLLQKKPLEAERVLLSARQFGDLPTLDYEIASARLAAGFFREAADTLKRNFTVNKDGLVETYLGNRILADAASFTELLSLERRATIFSREPADDAESARRLKALLDLVQKIEKTDSTEPEVSTAVDAFVSGNDDQRVYRMLFSANRLLARKIAVPKVLELMQSAVSGVDAGLNVPSPSAAVLADDLYDNRQYFISRGQIVSVNELPRQKLSAIIRGRIEETAGWAFQSQENNAQAIIRFKRALTVLPEKSTWWRSTWKRLGAALMAEGKEPEALEAYIKSYDTDQPNKEQRGFIADLWVKVNGKIDGLDARIGPDPFATTVASVDTTPEPSPTPKLARDVILPGESPSPTPSPTVAPTPEASPSPTPTVEPTPETSPSPTPTVEPTPEASPSPIPTAEPTPSPTPTVEPTPETSPSPTPTPSPTAEPTPKPLFDPVIIVVGKTTPTPTPETTPTPEPTPETSPTPGPEKSPAPQPTPASTTETVTTDQSGETRPRKVSEETPPCTVIVSQENLSIVAAGGTLGVLVGFDDSENDPATIVAKSSSPADIEITADRAIGFSSRRAFFVVRSVSEKTGVFTVTFEAACGKKEIQVRVR